jgi:Ni/Co efflux regulator RcnB
MLFYVHATSPRLQLFYLHGPSVRVAERRMFMKKLILSAAAAAAMVPFVASAPASAQYRSIQRDHTSGWTVYRAPIRTWRYRPVTIGFRLQPAFYGPRYSVTNYGTYRVRAPGRHQRWIRYGDDLLLVNVRTGRVLQVIHNRYW